MKCLRYAPILMCFFTAFSAYGKIYYEKGQLFAQLDRTHCEKLMANRDNASLRKQGSVHAGFIYHSNEGVNSKKAEEFSCGFKTASLRISTILYLFLAVAGFSLLTVCVVWVKKYRK